MDHDATLPLDFIVQQYNLYLSSLWRLSRVLEVEYFGNISYKNIIAPHYVELVEAGERCYRAREEFMELDPTDYWRITCHLNCFNLSIQDSTTHMRNIIKAIKDEDAKTIFYQPDLPHTITNYLDIESLL